MTDFELELINSEKPDWPQRINEIRRLLGAPDNPLLFPPHFLQSVFPKIGGRLILFRKDRSQVAVGFLFPRDFASDIPEFTLRFHAIKKNFHPHVDLLRRQLQELIGEHKFYLYVPEDHHTFRPTSVPMAGFEIGRPGKTEALQVRELQRRIWGYRSQADEDFLYPMDIHSADFRTGTSLVVRTQKTVVGFLFGFFKLDFSKVPEFIRQNCQTGFRIESQLLGVMPEFRGQNLGYLLKKTQAQTALSQGIQIINWTVDPLQLRNAVLNFGELRALAFNFYTSYYSFQNELNQVGSSRFGLTWLIKSDKVQKALAQQAKAEIRDLKNEGEVEIVNRENSIVNLESTADKIAIEIPFNWTALQSENLAEAKKWRESTDKIFSRYIGTNAGQYVVSGVGKLQDKRYLIADKVNALR